MSIFDKDIIKNESDIEFEKKRRAFIKALRDASNKVNKLSKKGTQCYMIVGGPDLGKVLIK